MCKNIYIAACLAFALSVSAQNDTGAVKSPGAETAKAVKADAPKVSPERMPDLDDKHPLGPGDKVSFLIQEDKDVPNLPKTLLVTDARDLEVPYIGRVSVKDKTCKEVAAEIKVLLEKDYYYTATVKLGLDQVNKRRGFIYVSGNVRSPGTFELLFDEPMTAGHAIVKAGGFSDFADKTAVLVIHNGSNKPGDVAHNYIVDMKKVIDKGDTLSDHVLEPGDTVQVGQRGFNIK